MDIQKTVLKKFKRLHIRCDGIGHPDNNYGYHTTEMMTMINTAKDVFQDRLSENYRVREEENVQSAEDVESIRSDNIKYGNHKTTKCTSRSKSQCEKFSKKQNDLKIKELKEYAANT